MASPAIFSGAWAKLLNSKGILKADGSVLENEGPVNYIKNGHFEINATGWTSYADAAAATPVDATGGAATLTIARSTTSPLRGVGCGLVTKPASNVQGQGASYDFTIDTADKNKTLSLSFDYEGSSGFTAGDLSDVQVFVYDVTNSTLLYVTPQTLKAGTGQFAGTFQASTSTSYRLVLHVATTSATAWTLKLDQVVVGPKETVFASATSDWQTYTMTIGATTTAPTKGTTSIDRALWRRVGDSMEIMFGYQQTGAGSAGSGTYQFSLPSGYTIDSAKIPTTNTTGNHIVGNGTAYDGAGFYDAQVIVTSNLTSLYLVTSSETASLAGVGSGNLPLSNANVRYGFVARVPIAGWSGNVASANGRVFRISEVLANGTRVTGAAPASLGQYRSYRRNGTTYTFTETTADPGTAPSTTNGIRLYSANTFDANDTNNEPTKYDIFVGKNKHVSWQFFSTTGMTGFVDTDPVINLGGTNFGYFKQYNPSTGIATIQPVFMSQGTSAHFSGISDAHGAVTDCYFDLIVSENAIAVTAATNPKAKYQIASAPTISSATSTVVDFATKVYDTMGSVTTGASWRFTAPISGQYRVNSQVYASNKALNQTEVLVLYINKNGVQITQFARDRVWASITTGLRCNGSVSIQLNAGDYIDVRAYHDTSGTLSLLAIADCFVEIERLAD